MSVFPMKIMAGLIRRGHEAKEVMEILDRAFAGVHRLDPCPCGSGRKFKQCHGRLYTSPDKKALPAAAITINDNQRLSGWLVEGVANAAQSAHGKSIHSYQFSNLNQQGE